MANTNGFEGVAWMIGGGAKHSADVGRLLAYAATKGGEGVVEPTDLKVSATAGQADSQIHVSTGAGVIRNRSANALSQSYVVRAPQVSHLDVAPTGAAGRSDLVVVRVKDPQFPPWQPVSDPVNGPYVIPEIIPGVPAGTTDAKQLGLTHSMIALARLDIPPNTTNITAGMIVPLRRLAQVNSWTEIKIGAPTQGDRLDNSLGEQFPSYAPQIWVPEWATRAIATATLSSVGQNGGGAQGNLTVVLNPPGQGAGGLRAQDIGFDLDPPAQGGSRHTLVVAADWPDIRSIAGSYRQIRLEGIPINRAIDTGYLETVNGTQVIYSITFLQEPL